MSIPLRVLIIEDSEFDARMLVSVLRKGGYDPAFERVETAGQMKAALAAQSWEVILSDYNMPQFSALEALSLLQQSGLDLPFIVVSGGIGEDTAVAAMKAGAHDYLMKGNLARLAPAVERELREAISRAARRQAEASVRESELRYRLLWETAADAIILMDTGSQILFANPAVKEVFGYAPEEVIGQSLTMLQPEPLRAVHVTGLARYLGSGVKQLNWRATETVGLRKDGQEIPVELSFSEMELSGERRFVGFIRDITGRKKAEAELHENQEQFRVAREIQQRLFPKTSPAFAGFDIAGATYPAEATGGDYFDYLPMQHGRLGIVVADVTGHGVGPALLMSETRAYLRLLALNRDDVGEILTRANLVLAEDVDYEHFVTLLLAQLDPEKRTLIYSSAGHPAGYLLDPAGNIKARLGRTGIPLGLKGDTCYPSGPPLTLAPGEIVLLLTDGIEEAMAPDNSFFGIERTVDVVRDCREQPAAAIVEALYRAVRDFARHQPQMDDFTAIIVKVGPPPA